MARRLDLAMSTDGPRSKGNEEPNGYGGINRSGELNRLLMSDWGIAAIEPDEFLRRYVNAELSYLELEFDAPDPTPAIAVVVDAGPDQLGARRLAQLAGLATLDRRARALNIPLMLGVLGDSTYTWHEGELPELFSVWLRARTASVPTASDLDGWAERDPLEATRWLFGGDKIQSDEISGHWRRLSALESQWTSDGAIEIEATVDGRSLLLPLPTHAECIQLLRGHGLRRSREISSAESGAALRFPQMPGASRRLVARGESADLLHTVTIPHEPGRQPGKVKRHWFAGPVLAATVVGPRTVALVRNQSQIQVAVVGKRLGRVHEIDVPMAELGLDEATADRICETGLGQLLFKSGSIIAELDGQWWVLNPPDEVDSMRIVAGAATSVVDQPRLASLSDSGLIHDRKRLPISFIEGSRVLLGPESALAIEYEAGLWQSPLDDFGLIEVPPDCTVHGLTRRNGRPTLVTQSQGGHILRLVGPGADTTTLTDWSKDVASVALHPTLPLLAIQRLDQTIDVLDVAQAPVRLVRIEPGS